MHRFKVVEDTDCVPLVALADWLFGCSHRRTSFPITLRTSTEKAETYVVCLQCARRFEYDWTTMRITGQPATPAGGDRDQTGYRTRTAFPVANRLFHRLLAFPAGVGAGEWNKIAKSTSRLLAMLALASILTWAPGAEASSTARGTSFAPFDGASQDQGNNHKKRHQALKHKDDDDRDEDRNQDRNRDQREGGKKHKTGQHSAGVHATAPVFDPRDHDIIGGYYQNRYSNLPPGLAKRGGELPPGHERQLVRNGTLPRGLQKRLEPFPPELSRQLPPLHPDYTRGLIGGTAVIVNRRTGKIVDVMHNVLNSSGR